MGKYEVSFEPEDLPDEPPPDIDMELSEPPVTDLEGFIEDGNYVVYRQQ